MYQNRGKSYARQVGETLIVMAMLMLMVALGAILEHRQANLQQLSGCR